MSNASSAATAILRQRVERFRMARRAARSYGVLALLLVSVLSLTLQFLWYFLVVAPFFANLLKGDKLVLWLRRFRKEDRDAYPFSEGLLAACRTLGAVPVTIQDPTFSHSDAMGLARGRSVPRLVWAGIRPTLWMIPVAGLFGMVVTAFLLDKEPHGDMTGPTWAVALLLGGFLALGIAAAVRSFRSIRREMRQLGFQQLNREDAERVSADLIGRIKQGEIFGNGVEVLRCGNDFWQQTVQQFLRRADALAIDVTHLSAPDRSENLLWEIETAFHDLRPEAILLVHRDAEGALPADTRAALLERIPETTLERARVLAYRGSGRTSQGPARKALLDGVVAGLSGCFGAAPPDDSASTAAASPPVPHEGWTRRLRTSGAISLGSLVLLCLFALGQELSQFHLRGRFEELGAWTPILVLFGLIHILATVRLVTYLPRLRPRRRATGLVALLLVGYLAVIGLRAGFAYAEIRRSIGENPFLGLLVGGVPVARETAEALRIQVPDPAEAVRAVERQALEMQRGLAGSEEGGAPMDFQKGLADAIEQQRRLMETYSRRMKTVTDSLVRAGVPYGDALTAAGRIAGREMEAAQEAMARKQEELTRQAPGSPYSESMESADESGEEDGPRAPFLLRALSNVSSNLGQILFYVGVVGVIQAWVSRRSNREMNAALAAVKRLARAGR